MRPGLITFALAVVGAALFGCNDDTTKPPESPYADALTHPDSLLSDLMTAYERREIEPYANLLARDFKFVFAQEDVTPDIPLGYWNAAEDSAATRRLFESTQVAQIRIALTWLPPTPETLDGWSVQRVIVVQTFLDVSQTNGITLRIDGGDQQVFYFRAGRPELGEDSSRLYIVQWEERGWYDGGLGNGVSTNAAVEATTWGRIKQRF